MSNEKLDWIYKGISGLVDREDYLTGRKIDKTFQLLEQHEKGQKGDLDVDTSIPPSIFTSNDIGSVDLINKMREDPLYKMKKRQADENKKILQNPIKMKKLKLLIESTIERSGSHKNKKKKKNSKLKRDSSSSDDDRKSRKRHRHKTSSSSSSTASTFKATPEEKIKRRIKRKSSRLNNRKKSQSSHSASNTFSTSSSNRYDSHHSSQKNQSSSQSSSFHYHYKSSRKQEASKQRLSNKQLEKKRQEMLEAGSWRERQRKTNVEQYKKEEDKNKDGYFCGEIVKN